MATCFVVFRLVHSYYNICGSHVFRNNGFAFTQHTWIVSVGGVKRRDATTTRVSEQSGLCVLWVLACFVCASCVCFVCAMLCVFARLRCLVFFAYLINAFIDCFAFFLRTLAPGFFAAFPVDVFFHQATSCSSALSFFTLFFVIRHGSYAAALCRKDRSWFRLHPAD